jgi:hypothetical protein
MLLSLMSGSALFSDSSLIRPILPSAAAIISGVLGGGREGDRYSHNIKYLRTVIFWLQKAHWMYTHIIFITFSLPTYLSHNLSLIMTTDLLIRRQKLIHLFHQLTVLARPEHRQRSHQRSERQPASDGRSEWLCGEHSYHSRQENIQSSKKKL